jgi:hypothetical protein
VHIGTQEDRQIKMSGGLDDYGPMGEGMNWGI